MPAISILLLAGGLISLSYAVIVPRLSGYNVAADELSRWGALADGIGFLCWAYALAEKPPRPGFILPGAVLLMFGVYVNLKPSWLRWKKARR